MQVEPGIGAIKYSIGYGHTGMMSMAALKACVVTTTVNQPDIPPHRAYAGLEWEGMALAINLSLGVHRRIDGDDGEHTCPVTAGIGVGF